MDINEKIDIILSKINGSEGADLNDKIPEWLVDHPDPVDNIIISNHLKKEDLVTIKDGSKNEYVITLKGRRIKDKGGWKKYLTDQEEEARLDRQQIESVINTNNSVIQTNSLQKRILWFTAIFTFITLVIAGLDYQTNREQLKLQQTPQSALPKQKIQPGKERTDSSGQLTSDSLVKK